VPEVPVILIVEDDAPLRVMWRTALRFEGFTVVEAGDGLEALRLLDGSPPNLILLDLGLPNLDGVSVRKDISGQVLLRDIPVVIITGSTEDLSDLHVPHVLRKPVTVEQVVRVVQQCTRHALPSVGG
jgi:CheY-like chemotaxis protein